MQPVRISELLRSTRLPALDGLRAVSVGLVVGGHFGLSTRADLGVETFFVLSGFLITWLLLQEREATGSVSIRRFYFRRLLRIFPAYYVFLAIAITVDLIRGDDRIRPAILPGLTYLTNYYNALTGHAQNSIAHAWSLANEEQFYLLWPAAFLWLARRGSTALVRGLVAAIVVVLIWRNVAFIGLGLGPAWAYNAFDSRADNLAIGCLLAVLAKRPWFDGAAAVTVRWPVLSLVPVMLLAWSHWDRVAVLRYGIGFTLDPLLIAIALVQILQLHRHAIWRWLSHPAVAFVGTISYPIYLYHGWAIGAGIRISQHRAVQFAVACVACLIFGSMSYYVVERPFLRLKHRFESRRSTVAPD